MTKVRRQVYTEVDEILKYLPSTYLEKIPMKYRRMFSDCRLPDYEVKLDTNKSLLDQNLHYDTYVVITILRYKFWCNDEERQKMMEEMKEYDRQNESKYDFSKLNERAKHFNEITKEDVKENLPVVAEKQSWFSKFILKIKGLFKK